MLPDSLLSTLHVKFSRAGILVFALFFMPALLFAAVNYTDVKVSGYGETRDDAIASALVTAVQQVGGVSVNTARQIETRLFEISSDSTFGGHQEIQGSVQRKVEFLGVTKGLVDSYEIVSEKNQKSAGGKEQWQVQILAKVVSYQAPRDQQAMASRPSIAILPFRVNGHTRVSADGKWQADTLASQLTENLVNSSQFRVLDRFYLNEYAAELNDMQFSATNPREAVRLGQKLGADYMLVGNFDQFMIEEKVKDMYGSSFVTYKLKGDVQYRLIDVASNMVRVAKTYKPAYSSAEIKKLLDQDYFDPGESSEARQDAMRAICADIAEKIASEVIFALNPS